MNKTTKFAYPSAFGKVYPNCTFETASYANNGNNALQIYDEEGEMLITCSVNPSKKLDKNHICIKDYSENEGMVNFLSKMGIIGKWVEDIPSGWVVLPVYELTESGLELFK